MPDAETRTRGRCVAGVLAPTGDVSFGSVRRAGDDPIAVPMLPVPPMRLARCIRHGVLSPSVALAARVRELRANGVDIINFGTRPDVPQHVKRAAVDCLDSGASAACTVVRGLPDLRKAIVGKLASENALEVDAEREIVVTAGAKPQDSLQTHRVPLTRKFS